VLVLGGGFAGTTVCKRLQHAFSTTLLTSETYFEFTPSILRATVEPEHFDAIQVGVLDYSVALLHVHCHHAVLLSRSL
jgi:NADH dehydrogenase FAD-containing subunit